ncbi:MAG: NAD-dependent epimerase/dehydratase family protein [bacterium]|nr:NAD-dependent epimerase/dehydratase family protein [bacterium]
MKILITGGSGFIGSHVVERLLARGIRVRIYDLIYPEFIKQLPEDQKDLVDHYQGSLLEEDRIRLASSGMDAIFHLAAVADVNEIAKDPKYAQRINNEGTFNILETARMNPSISRVIFASTIWVYQNTPQGNGPLVEDSPLALPSHFYTATKISGEANCIAYSQLFDVPVTVLRFGIPYGPRSRGSIVSAMFTKKAFNKEPIIIEGDGSQYRKFVYVEDLAEGCVLALKDIAKNRTYNLEGDEKVSIKQVAETVRELIGDVEVQYKEGRKGDFSGKEISNARAKQELGWMPKTTFKDGMGKYIIWYKKNVLGKEQAQKIII